MPSASLKTTNRCSKVVNAPSVLIEWTHGFTSELIIKFLLHGVENILLKSFFPFFRKIREKIKTSSPFDKFVLFSEIKKEIKYKLNHNEGVYRIVYVIECCFRSSRAKQPTIHIFTRMFRQRFDLLCTNHGTSYLSILNHFIFHQPKKEKKPKQYSNRSVQVIFVLLEIVNQAFNMDYQCAPKKQNRRIIDVCAENNWVSQQLTHSICEMIKGKIDKELEEGNGKEIILQIQNRSDYGHHIMIAYHQVVFKFHTKYRNELCTWQWIEMKLIAYSNWIVPHRTAMKKTHP